MLPFLAGGAPEALEGPYRRHRNRVDTYGHHARDASADPAFGPEVVRGPRDSHPARESPVARPPPAQGSVTDPVSLKSRIRRGTALAWLSRSHTVKAPAGALDLPLPGRRRERVCVNPSVLYCGRYVCVVEKKLGPHPALTSRPRDPRAHEGRTGQGYRPATSARTGRSCSHTAHRCPLVVTVQRGRDRGVATALLERVYFAEGGHEGPAGILDRRRWHRCLDLSPPRPRRTPPSLDRGDGASLWLLKLLEDLDLK